MTEHLRVSLRTCEIYFEIEPKSLHLLFNKKVAEYRALLGTENVCIYHSSISRNNSKWYVRTNTMVHLHEQLQLFYKLANEAKEEIAGIGDIKEV